MRWTLWQALLSREGDLNKVMCLSAAPWGRRRGGCGGTHVNAAACSRTCGFAAGSASRHTDGWGGSSMSCPPATTYVLVPPVSATSKTSSLLKAEKHTQSPCLCTCPVLPVRCPDHAHRRGHVRVRVPRRGRGDAGRCWASSAVDGAPVRDSASTPARACPPKASPQRRVATGGAATDSATS